MKQRKQYLLEKFLNNRCSREELNELLTCLEEDEEKEYEETMHRVWEQLHEYTLLDEATLARISGNVSASVKQEAAAAEVRLLVSHPWYRYAATLTGLLMVLGAVYFLMMNRSSLIEYKTAYGETMQVVLPDSSVVTLNGNSHLSYASEWHQKAMREVWLEGEAFFEVRRKNEQQASSGNALSEGLKFLVHTANFNVEVLGTSFNVNDRGDRASVVLHTGKVRLQKHDELTDIMMQPGDLVAFSKESKAMLTKTVDPDLYNAWTKNKLVFEHTPLPEIARLLEDNYGLEVTLGNKTLEERIFTGTIPTIQVDVLLTILEESLQINITRKGNQVIME